MTPAIKDELVHEQLSLAPLFKDQGADVCRIKLKPVEVLNFDTPLGKGAHVRFTIDATVEEVQLKNGKHGEELVSVAKSNETSMEILDA